MVTPGTCVRIVTGAEMPRGADSVVPVEWTDGGTVNVRIAQQPSLGASVRRAGEDVHAGDQVLEQGTVLGPRQIAVLAAVGRARVKARPRPRVVVVSTGAELRELGSRLGEGQIYDSNSYTMAACARDAGAVVDAGRSTRLLVTTVASQRGSAEPSRSVSYRDRYSSNREANSGQGFAAHQLRYSAPIAARCARSRSIGMPVTR